MLDCYVKGDAPLVKNQKAILYRGCGGLSIFSKYIVLRGTELFELSNAEDFKNAFSPVDSADEALAFAVALTGFHPKNDKEVPLGYIKMVEKIRTTSIESVEGGYTVRLFGYQCEGCESHPYFFIDLMATTDGEVREISRENVYRNPEEDFVCND